MSGRFQDQVVLVTGAARGQGQATAEAFAREGADIIAIDVCAPIAADSPPSSTEDFAETIAAVEGHGRRILARSGDVRDLAGLEAIVNEGVAQFGRLDVISASAGIAGMGRADQLEERQWDTMIAVNLSGVWRTCRAAIPHIVRGGRGGAIILTASAAGLKGMPYVSHYAAAKHGVIGLMRSLAAELGPRSIRVNAVCSTTVRTPLIAHEGHYKLFRPDLDHPTADDITQAASKLNALPVPWIEVEDVANAILWLSSNEARYVTGVALPVDAGFLIK